MENTDTVLRQFSNSLEHLAQLHGTTLTSEIALMYFNALQPYDEEDVHSAIERATQTSQWFPKPLDLVKSIEDERERQYRLWIHADNERGKKRHTAACLEAWNNSDGLGQCLCGANVTVVGENGLATVVARDEQKDPAPK
jgi:hypothetical protein